MLSNFLIISVPDGGYSKQHGMCTKKKGEIKIRNSKNRQHSSKKKKDKGTNNDLQNTAQKTKDWATRIQLKTEGEVKWSGSVSTLLFSTSIKKGGRHAGTMLYNINTCITSHFSTKRNSTIGITIESNRFWMYRMRPLQKYCI